MEMKIIETFLTNDTNAGFYIATNLIKNMKGPVTLIEIANKDELNNSHLLHNKCQGIDNEIIILQYPRSLHNAVIIKFHRGRIKINKKNVKPYEITPKFILIEIDSNIPTQKENHQTCKFCRYFAISTCYYQPMKVERFSNDFACNNFIKK